MFTDAILQRRIQRVRVLLETHDEPYDAELSRPERSATGFSETRVRRYRCGVCAGEGCERCERGRVTIEERDAYDEGEKGFWAGPEPAKTMNPGQVERALAALREDQLKRDGVIADVDFEASLERAEQRDRRGSYRELRAALDFLPASRRGEEALRWLAEHMPGSIRIPRWAFDAELEQIETEVVELKRHGFSRQEIAEALSISQRQVKSALRRARPVPAT